MKPTEIIPLFDTFMLERNLVLEAVLVGGAALALLGIIARETRDRDIIEPDLPLPILEAAKAFATELSGAGVVLHEDWLNNGPSQLGLLLPEGWRTRLQAVYVGRAIRLWAPGCSDFLLTKLFALCDRGLDLGDCVALRPTLEEPGEAAAWVVRQDANPEWPAHVQATLEDLGTRCGHGL